MALLGAIIFGGLAWIADRADRNTRGAQSVRLKFSSTQSIEVSNEPGHNDTVRLDNAGVLVQHGEADLERVRMVLAELAPLTIRTPDARTRYPSAPGRFTQLPGAGSPDIDVGEWSSVSGPSFMFHRWNAQAHTISAGQRVFEVRLLEVDDRSDSERDLTIYTFGVSEA
jgi:hypothetical protein